MRMMMKVSIPVETGNEMVRKGILGSTIQKALADIKPEAAYFAEEDGRRTGFVFFDMTDSSQLPAIAEPFFLAFNATVTLRPAMNAADLEKAAPSMNQAAKTFGATAG